MNQGSEIRNGKMKSTAGRTGERKGRMSTGAGIIILLFLPFFLSVTACSKKGEMERPDDSLSAMDGANREDSIEITEDLIGRRINSDSVWSTIIEEETTTPVITRFRTRFPRGIDTNRYPYLMLLTWDYDAPQSNGMPATEDYEQMLRLEGDLTRALEGTNKAWMMLTVTGQGKKDWVWYARSDEETTTAIREILAAQSELPVKLEGRFDAGWVVYMNFIRSVARDAAAEKQAEKLKTGQE